MALSASSASEGSLIKLEDFWGAQKVSGRGLHLPVNGFGELCERGLQGTGAAELLMRMALSGSLRLFPDEC